MLVGTASIELYIPMAGSLKDKRSVIKGLMKKARNKFNVAIAEVDQNDLWKNATIGVVTIGNKQRFIEKILNKVIAFLDESHELEVINFNIEIQ